MSDPFLIDGPACLSVSGGRTSMMLLRLVLDAHGGTLPDDVHAIFANTGKEREETLRFVRECETRWNVPIHWVQYAGVDTVMPQARAVIGGVVRLPHSEVTYETAAREGEPFARLIAERSYLPNPVTRICTEILKLRTMKRWLMGRGYEHWTSVVGLRFDEPARVSRIHASEREREDVLTPLYDARITVADVMAWWGGQPFDLALRPWEGNCDLCFLKGRAKRERIMRDRPDLAAWWVTQESGTTTSAGTAATFRAHEPPYAKLLANVTAQRHLPMLLDDPTDEGSSLPCACTD